MILLAKKHTCGTQETLNPAFGEDIRHADENQNAAPLNYCVRSATGSVNIYRLEVIPPRGV